MTRIDDVRTAARALHAADIRRYRPDSTRQELLTAWEHLDDAGRREGYLAAAREGADAEHYAARLEDLTGARPDTVALPDGTEVPMPKRPEAFLEALARHANAAEAAGADVRFEFGDRIRFGADGVDRELVVTSEPNVGTDGSLAFTAADPEAHKRAERLRGLLDLEPHHAAARQRTDGEEAALAESAVGHWARRVEVHHATCGCGQPMVYNLAAKVVAHTSDAVDPCEWPWPGEPMPDGVKAEIMFWRAGSKVMDRWLAQQSTTDAPALGIGGAR